MVLFSLNSLGKGTDSFVDFRFALNFPMVMVVAYNIFAHLTGEAYHSQVTW